MNVSKGDLAYITNDKDNPQDNGKTVLVGAGYVDVDFGQMWICTSSFVLGGFDIESDESPRVIQPGKEAHIPDDMLRRIAGPSIKINIETDAPLSHEVPA